MNKHETRIFKTDSEGTAQEMPAGNNLDPGSFRQDLTTGEIEVTLDNGGTRHFYIDYEGHRILDVDTNEWTQFDSQTSPNELILSKLNSTDKS